MSIHLSAWTGEIERGDGCADDGGWPGSWRRRAVDQAKIVSTD
jgi:hypothetical protein